MALEVDYIPFATGGGANVYAPATYQALAVVGTGVEPGLADPQLANTTWRLASMITAALANFIANTLNINILDDGNLSNLITNLTSAIQAGGQVAPSRIVTSSANLNINVSDYAVMFSRTAGVAVTTATLPSGATVGQKFRLGDLAGNFQAFPLTIAAPIGHSISGYSSMPVNVNHRTVEVEYHGSSLWSISGAF